MGNERQTEQTATGGNARGPSKTAQRAVAAALGTLAVAALCAATTGWASTDPGAQIGSSAATLAATLLEIHHQVKAILIGLAVFALFGVGVAAWFGRFPYGWFYSVMGAVLFISLGNEIVGHFIGTGTHHHSTSHHSAGDSTGVQALVAAYAENHGGWDPWGRRARNTADNTRPPPPPPSWTYEGILDENDVMTGEAGQWLPNGDITSDRAKRAAWTRWENARLHLFSNFDADGNPLPESHPEVYRVNEALRWHIERDPDRSSIYGVAGGNFRWSYEDRQIGGEDGEWERVYTGYSCDSTADHDGCGEGPQADPPDGDPWTKTQHVIPIMNRTLIPPDESNPFYLYS